MTRDLRWAAAAGLLASVGALSCANVESPPGTAPDNAPPGVRERYPPPDAVVPDLDGDAYLRFDEPIQSPRSLERQVDYSPAWEWRFTPLTNGFKTRPRDGWRPGVVYRIRLAPGVTDLLRNRTTGPIEWSFSTGPEIPPTRVEGTIFDRVAVQGVRDARLLFLPPDSTPYTVVSDTGGSYSMRGLPPGDYTVLGFVDQNQNRRLDFGFEPWDSAAVVIADETTRLALDLWMIPPDSTAPVLTGASAPDSLTVLLQLDDPIDPEASLEAASVELTREDGGEGPAAAAIEVGAPRPADARAAAAAGERGAVPDLAAADSLGAPPPDAEEAAPAEVPPEEEGGERAGLRAPAPERAEVARMREMQRREEPAAEAAQPAEAFPGEAGGEQERAPLRRTDLPPVPSTTVTVRLATPLAPGGWRVRATGLPNLRGLVGGGDTTFVYEPSPPPADTGAVGEAGEAAIDTVPPTPAPGRDLPAAPVPPAGADSAEAGRPPDSADGEEAP
jgi:hypothetical protein